MSNAELVQEIYAAFGRGDVEAIVGRLAEDVEWDHYDHEYSAQEAGLAYLARRRGPEEVRGFFAALAENLEFSRFEPLALLTGDNRVAAVIAEQATNRTTGTSFSDTAVHLWGFTADGRVSSLQHFVDTAKHIEASRP